MERTSGMLQVLRTNYISSQDAISNFSWTPFIQIYGELQPEQIDGLENNSLKVLEYLILDKENSFSVYNNIRQSRENARAIQDHITKEAWQCLNDTYHSIRDPQFQILFRTEDPVTAIDVIIKDCMLFNGTLKNTMTRGESYTYMHLGKFLERAIIFTDILRIHLNQYYSNSQKKNGESPALRYLLYSLLGYQMYMKTYKANFDPQHILEMSVYNNYFPHSLVYSVHQVVKYFERLKPESLPYSYEEVEFQIGKTMNAVKYSNLKLEDEKWMGEFLFNTRQQLVGIGNCLAKYYFGHT